MVAGSQREEKEQEERKWSVRVAGYLPKEVQSANAVKLHSFSESSGYETSTSYHTHPEPELGNQVMTMT